MLTRLSIRNIVLIEALDLDFAGGLGVLTGETGAGKSILLDALGLVLGNRAENGLVRAGEDKASVTACFEFDPLPDGVRTVVEEAISIICEALANGEKTYLVGLGVFDAYVRKGIVRHHPVTGKAVKIGDKVAVSFRAASGLKRKLNDGGDK